MSVLKLIYVEEPTIDSSSVDAKYRPREITLYPDKGHIVIGRNNGRQRPDYCIESAQNSRMISRKHATLEQSPQGFKIYDHSLNGTFLNYSRVVGGTILKEGNIVTFGHLNGANIKSGEKVSEYRSDLKYRVEITEIHKPDSSSHSNVSLKNKRSSLKSNVKPSQQPPSKVPRKSTDSVVSDQSLTQSKTSISSTTKLKPGSGIKMNRKKDMPKGHLMPFAGPSDAPPTGENMFHTDNDQCNAKPCKKPLDVNIDWIQCDKCNAWYHQICVGIVGAHVIDETETYVCPYCIKKF